MFITILGVRIHTLSYQQIKDLLVEQLRSPSKSGSWLVVTPNPELVVYAQQDPEYKAILNQANLALPDGIGLVWVSRGRIQQRITGVDVLPLILHEAEQLGLSVGIVYRTDGLATPDQITTGLHRQYPKLQLAFTDTDFTIVPDVIVVTIGYPEQEQWFHSRKQRYQQTRLVLAAGGAVDFLIGVQRRAPSWIQVFGVEWLWRLVHQPQRWRRIVTAVIIFPWLILRQLIVKHTLA